MRRLTPSSTRTRGWRPVSTEDVDFSQRRLFPYNWEVFFHIPLLMATRLSGNQRFEEAQRWFHYIFDPTETKGEAPAPILEGPAVFKNADVKVTIQELMQLLAGEPSARPTKRRSRSGSRIRRRTRLPGCAPPPTRRRW